MDKQKILKALFWIGSLLLPMLSCATVQGIYLTQYSLENTAFLQSIIPKAKAAGINTFVIDLEDADELYEENIRLVKKSGIQYVARIVMFPGGGTKEQIENPQVWQKNYELVQQAVNMGADGIQLDYIRYNTKQKPSPENAKNINKIISWYKDKLSRHNVRLEIDIFGEVSFGESSHIGQNLKVFSQSVDGVCPMVYPSHYIPYPVHFRNPYGIVYKSLEALKDQFNDKVPVKIYPYIELSNYHFPMTQQQKINYINEQIRAVEAADSDGWYAWSPHNKYDNLFTVLKNRR